MEEARGVVAAIAYAVCERVVASYVHDTRVVAVTLQQDGAIAEEGRLGKDVVLKDYPLLDILEEPVDRARDCASATEVFIQEPCVDLAGPVHLCHHLARQTAAFGVVRMRRARPVSRDEEAAWPGLANCREDARRVLRAAKMIIRTGGVGGMMELSTYLQRWWIAGD